MGDLFLLGLRILAGTSGLLLIAAAAFLYEGEEKQVQSVLEDWWVRIDDLGRTAVSRHVAFYMVVASKAEKVLVRLVGPRILGAQTILRFPILAFGILGLTVGLSAGDWKYFLVGVVVGLLACSPSMVFFGTLAVAIAFVAVLEPSGLPSLALAFGSLVLLGSINLPFIFFVRRAFREASGISQEGFRARWLVLLLPVMVGRVTIVIFGLFVVVIFGASEHLAEPGAGQFRDPVGFLGGAGIFITSSLGKGIFTFSLLMPWLGLLPYSVLVGALLVNRVLWPLPNRVLYALQRSRLLENRALLWKVGVALLTAAAMPWASAFETVGAYF